MEVQNSQNPRKTCYTTVHRYFTKDGEVRESVLHRTYVRKLQPISDEQLDDIFAQAEKICQQYDITITRLRSLLARKKI